MKKLKKIDASCAVVALCYASGLDEETVLRVCQSYGFEAGEGMADDEWQAAAKTLGLKVKSVAFNNPLRLKAFIKVYDDGLYLLGTYNHLFCLDNGLIIDPRETPPMGLGRVVKQAWKVFK